MTRRSEERFKQINLAYETLRDPERRRQYDMFGPAGVRGSGAAGAGAGDPFAGFGGGGGLGDLFDAFFGGGARGGAGGCRGPDRARGEDAEATLTLEFAEAVFGVQHELTVRLPQTCATCTGTGARPGTTPITCSVCHGVGRGSPGPPVDPRSDGDRHARAPAAAGRRGDHHRPAPTAGARGGGGEERSFVVEVPAGVDEGSTLRLPGRGAGGMRGGPPGDLYVHLRVRPHPTITRRGADLLAVMHVAMTQAALGVTVPFETLDGAEELAVRRRHPKRAGSCACAAGACPISRAAAGATWSSPSWSTCRPT